MVWLPLMVQPFDCRPPGTHWEVGGEGVSGDVAIAGGVHGDTRGVIVGAPRQKRGE